MKKILLSIFALFLTLTAANASSDKIHVTTVSEFNTENPSEYIDVKVIEDGTLGEYNLKAGDIIHCSVVKVTDPKRGKRTATFSVHPISYTSDGSTTKIEKNYYGKYASKIISKEELKNLDPVQVGKKTAVTVGGYFVKGLAPAVSMAEGMIKNEEGNIIESGVKKVYKDSPLSYVEKGQELDLNPGEKFYIIFKPSQSNYYIDTEQEVSE